MLDHGEDCLIPLVVGLVQLNSLWPHLVHFASSDQFWNVESLPVGSDMVHESVFLVFGIHDSQLGVDTIVGSLVAHALFKELDQLLHISELLVLLDQVLQMVWLNNNVETAESSCLEFLGSDA